MTENKNKNHNANKITDCCDASPFNKTRRASGNGDGTAPQMTTQNGFQTDGGRKKGERAAAAAFLF